MKKIKKILIGCICVLAVVMLAAYGFGMFDKQKPEEVAQEKAEKKDEAAGEEMLYQEEFGIEYPAVPKEVGIEIIYDEDFTMPSDDSIKNLSVYEFHDMFGENETKKQEKYADTLSEKLLKDFFPGEKWKRTVNSDSWDHNYVYRIRGKEENGFQYTASKQGIDNTQLLCEPGEITVPVPEDGNYDKAYQEFSMEMLQYFQVGLWDGENVHMALRDTEDVTETGGYYRYMIELDGIGMTKCQGFDDFANGTMVWAAFHYEDGSLLRMLQMAQKILDGKRECKLMYSSAEEAVDVLKQAMEIYYKQFSNRINQYFILNVKGVSLEYVEDREKDGTPCYVPIFTAYIQKGSYDFSSETWEWGEEGYAIQLETGENDRGYYQEDAWAWEAPMTDRND
jgi:hypothetical protein